MATINVYNEILTWSSSRPMWQRDALRRLTEKGELDETDIVELANLCKSFHGLHDRMSPSPLSEDHIPQPGGATKSISLESLTHHIGVNALAKQQTIQFGAQLTVVYGNNATGKSGYTRILKRVCRARGAEEVLGNIMSGSTPRCPSATIKFKVDGEPKHVQWDDSPSSDRILSRISVFDRHCASVYIAKPTDVAFRPLGLDLFDKLADACQNVRKSLERESSALESQEYRFAGVAVAGTAVHDLVTNLHSLTEPASIASLASLTDTDNSRIVELRRMIRDLQSENPESTARTLELRAARVKVLINHLYAVDKVLSDAGAQVLFRAYDQMDQARRAAKNLRKETFQGQPLNLTGSETWRVLWDAAKRFSVGAAYPQHPFPFTGDNSRCVLCQQILQAEGVERLQQFEEFFQNDIQSDCDEKTENYNRIFAEFNNLEDLTRSTEETLAEVQLDDSDLAKAVNKCLNSARARRESIRRVLTNRLSNPDNLPEWILNIDGLTQYCEALEARAKKLLESNRPESVTVLKDEFNELEARQQLSDHKDSVLEEIERKKRIAAYKQCIEDTRTNAITNKSSAVTKRAVTGQLTSSFERELSRLDFDHVEVQVVAAGGVRGVLRHKLRFRRAPKTEVNKVVSDGEARCLSIASFFAELSTTSEKSAILFDDPVSSLDHMWRRKIANRLAEEAQSRQVIVFTHDIAFLHALKKRGKELDIDVFHQHLRREGTNSGLSSQELPWVAERTNERISYLKRRHQSARTAFRKGDTTTYESDVSHIYGRLREAWERGVEEVLLSGIVQRFDEPVKTQLARFLTDICEDDIEKLNQGMAKCSRWIFGHDTPIPDSGPPPSPDELLQDIKELENWVKSIRRRRN